MEIYQYWSSEVPTYYILFSLKCRRRKWFMPVTDLSPKSIARSAYRWCNDSWANVKYVYRDRLRNSPSRMKFEAQIPALSDTQERVVQDLATRGIAFAHFDELFGDVARWDTLCRAYDDFANSEAVQENVRKYQNDYSDRT